MKRMISILCALVMTPMLAAADTPTATTPVACPKPVVNGVCTATPDDWYKYGEDQYNLGNFTKAIEAFKKGFELEPSDNKKAAYLFNIAQSYRQEKNCKEAGFFYKRYLAFKDADTVKPLPPAKRQEIEDRIKELEECVRIQEASVKKPPDGRPDGPKPPPPDPPDDEVTKTVETPARVISLRAGGGGAKLTTGDLKVPIQATFALLAGYPIHLNNMLSLDVGAGFTFTPVPFNIKVGAQNESKSAQLIGAFANAGITYNATSKFGLRGDLGLGALVFSGVSESPFTAGAPTSGALTMLHARVSASADYAITPNFIATVTPFAFSFSPAKPGLKTTQDGMTKNITTITAIDFMVGLGYRM